MASSSKEGGHFEKMDLKGVTQLIVKVGVCNSKCGFTVIYRSKCFVWVFSRQTAANDDDDDLYPLNNYP